MELPNSPPVPWKELPFEIETTHLVMQLVQQHRERTTMDVKARRELRKKVEQQESLIQKLEIEVNWLMEQAPPELIGNDVPRKAKARNTKPWFTAIDESSGASQSIAPFQAGSPQPANAPQNWCWEPSTGGQMRKDAPTFVPGQPSTFVPGQQPNFGNQAQAVMQLQMGSAEEEMWVQQQNLQQWNQEGEASREYAGANYPPAYAPFDPEFAQQMQLQLQQSGQIPPPPPPPGGGAGVPMLGGVAGGVALGGPAPPRYGGNFEEWRTNFGYEA